MKITILSLLILVASTATAQSIQYKTVTVEPYLSHQNYEHFKRLVMVTDEPEVEFLAGFEFEWGYRYKLKVKETKLRGELSDGTRYEYALEKVIEKTPVSDTTQFRMFIDPHIYYGAIEVDEETGAVTEIDQKDYALTAIDDSTWLYMEKVEIEVPEELREAFAELATAKDGRRGYFTFVNGKRVRLVRFF